MKKDLFIVCKHTKSGDATYVALVVDLGYRSAVLSFERAVISEITDIPCGKLSVMPADSKIKVGCLEITEK